MSTVERHERWVTDVPTMHDAFAFIMEHVDKYADPEVTIKPRRWYDGDLTGPDMSQPGELTFEVTVSGFETIT
ncbi:hypothetical protein [Curtobacterium sp. USHLN213]|uniref:hypothetical protein n=1 Tax=Curtobacterium sp. USHLN213 TaxID=3081255 RepID=UPI003017CE87